MWLVLAAFTSLQVKFEGLLAETPQRVVCRSPLGTPPRNGWPVRSVSSVHVHSAIRNAVTVVLSPPNASAIVSKLIELLVRLSLRMLSAWGHVVPARLLHAPVISLSPTHQFGNSRQQRFAEPR